MITIVGAGLSGLIAAQVFPHAQVVERGSRDQVNHKALLRFRSPRIGEVIGIDFRKVIVRKGIWDGTRYRQPNILLSNQYALKVADKLIDRSIWNLETVERYIAPSNLVQLLVERTGDRITWDQAFDFRGRDTSPFHENEKADANPVISTIPMPHCIDACSLMPPGLSTHPEDNDFQFADIVVKRFHVPQADVHQTVYFTDPDTTLYRASITGDVLIAEYMRRYDDNYNLLEPFGLLTGEVNAIDGVRQTYGKINPINEATRRNVVSRLTTDRNVYSLGRFATWRNILLDDVLHDAFVIKKLIGGDHYARQRQLAK